MNQFWNLALKDLDRLQRSKSKLMHPVDAAISEMQTEAALTRDEKGPKDYAEALDFLAAELESSRDFGKARTKALVRMQQRAAAD